MDRSFIASLVPAAVEHRKKYKLFASVTIAQAALESGWGKTVLARKANNLYGIKGIGPAGTIRMDTWEVVDGKDVSVQAGFKVYHCAEECLEDRARILTTLSRYRAVCWAETPEQQCRAILAGGWATDPAYADKLIKIIDQYDLQQYDVRSEPYPELP